MSEQKKPTPNIPLMLSVLAHIDAFPEKWDQGTWTGPEAPKEDPCGTAMCFAGWTVAIGDNHIPITEAHSAYREWDGTEGVSLLPTQKWEPGTLLEDPDSYVQERAARLLGLDEHEAHCLFDAYNGMEDIERVIGELAAGEPVRHRREVSTTED